MLTKKCVNHQKHSNNSIIMMCLESKCNYKRLLCSECLKTHQSSHLKTTLKLNSDSCKLVNYNKFWTSINSREKFWEVEKLLEETFYRPKAIFDQIRRKIKECQQNTFIRIEQFIKDSFNQDTPYKKLKIINNPHTSLSEIDQIAHQIYFSFQPHISTYQHLCETLNIVKDAFDSKMMNEVEEQIITAIQKLTNYCEHWSIMNNKVDWSEKLEDKTIIQKAKKEEWLEILQWTSKGNKISQLKQLILRGDRGQPKISKTIGGRNITKIGLFGQLNKLTNLTLSYNQITEIQNLQSMVELKVLCLADNYITKIKNLQHQKKLKQLWLQNNNISKIQNLDHFENLNLLDLSHNKIAKIENLSKLIKLQQLWLQSNFISKIQNLNYLKSLTTLNINSNRISKIQNLNHLIKLVRLNLSSNEIEVVQDLSYLPQLKQIQLCKNKYQQQMKIPLEEMRIIKRLSDYQCKRRLNFTLIFIIDKIMQEDIKVFQQNFTNSIEDIKQSPNQNRSCQDLLCLILFLIITSSYIFMGVSWINQQYNGPLLLSQNSSKSQIPDVPYKPNINIESLKKSFWYIIAITASSIILALVLVIIISAIPQIIVYTLIVLSIICIFGMGVMFVLQKSYLIGSLVLALGLGWGVILYCLWEYIDKGVDLLQATGRFMFRKPTVFLSPFIVGLIMLGLMFFWLYSLYGIYTFQINGGKMTAIWYFIWGLLGVFYTYFCYYMMVFMIATAASLWYYGLYEQNYVTLSFKWILSSHLGSLTFASIIITVLTVLRYSTIKAAQATQHTNPCYKCLYCIISCCIASLESLVSVLNHNAVIVMAVTGQSYVSSAKSAMALVYNNYQLFVVSDAIGVLVGIFGGVVIVGLPTIVGYFTIINKLTYLTEDQIALIMSMIIILGISVSILFVNILTESLSSIFILECLNIKFLEVGYKLMNTILPQLSTLFSHLNIGDSQQHNMIPLIENTDWKQGYNANYQ